MIQASFGEGLPSVSMTTAPRFTFWRDPIAFSTDPHQQPPVLAPDGRPIPTSSSGYPRPTRHLSGASGNTVGLGVGVVLSGLVGGFLLWRKWKGASKSFGSASKRRVNEELKSWDRLRMNERRPRANRPVWFVDPETGDLIELDYSTAAFNGLGASRVLRPSNPRIRFHDDGQKVTVSGMNYQDLRSILDLASIEAHESLEKDRDKDKEGEEYYRGRVKLLQYMHDQISSEISRINRQGRPVLPPTTKQRWANVREERYERLLLDKILDDMRSARKSKKKKNV